MKLSKAQELAMSAFRRMPGEPFQGSPIISLTARDVYMRAGGNFTTIGRTLDALEAKGLLLSAFSATDYRYAITEAGRLALRKEAPDAHR